MKSLFSSSPSSYSSSSPIESSFFWFLLLMATAHAFLIPGTGNRFQSCLSFSDCNNKVINKVKIVNNHHAPLWTILSSRKNEMKRNCQASNDSIMEKHQDQQQCYDSINNWLLLKPISSLNGVVTLPGSKSLSNRSLLLAALASGSTVVENLLDSDDISYMLQALEKLNVPIESLSKGTVKVTGQGGALSYVPDNSDNDSICHLFLGNAGTAMRPLTAALCFGKSGNFVLDGVPRMRERPIADLVDGLQQLGADISCVAETTCPPVTIRNTAEGIAGGMASISGKMSSQFLSSLLMAAPLARGDVCIKIKDELISAPYVALTLDLMKKFGVSVKVDGELNGGTPSFTISSDSKYISPGHILVEGDASSASYFLAGATITGGTITVRGCGSDSVQGDIAFANVMEQMGATVTWAPSSITIARSPDVKLRGVDVDCGKIPDAAMTLAVVALFAEGPTTIRNVYSWRLKETERMKAIVTECSKLGARVEEFTDYCIIHPPAGNKLNDDVLIETYDDHRMAMTFSLAACGGVSVRIHDPKCTAKTFPTYFDILSSLAI